MTSSCNKNGCDRTWERDPAVEVACPTCQADVGEKCKRPSGHGGNFVHPHTKRDLLALDEGHYGECPLGKCPESLSELERDVKLDRAEDDRDPEQPTLFEAA